MFPVEDKVYTGPIMAVGDVHAPREHKINNPKTIFLLIIVDKNLIHFKIQLKVE
jgi:hypothetical protein